MRFGIHISKLPNFMSQKSWCFIVTLSVKYLFKIRLVHNIVVSPSNNINVTVQIKFTGIQSPCLVSLFPESQNMSDVYVCRCQNLQT
jgi:hypothetical protein